MTRVLCAAVLVSACSFAAVQGPGSTSAHPESCTDSETLPAIDLAVGLTVGLGVSMATYAALGHRTCNPEALFSSADCGRGEISIGAGVLAALPWFVSSGWGSRQVRACKVRKETASAPAVAPPAPDFFDQEPTTTAPPDRSSAGRSLTDAADAEMAQGRYTDAARDYGAAYAATKDPALLQKLADAYAQAHECGTARGYYERYLYEARPTPEIVEAVQQRIAACAR